MCLRRRWGSPSPMPSGCMTCTEMPFNGVRIGTGTASMLRPPQAIRPVQIRVHGVSFVEVPGTSVRSVPVPPSDALPSRTAGTAVQGSESSGLGKTEKPTLGHKRHAKLATQQAGDRQVTFGEGLKPDLAHAGPFTELARTQSSCVPLKNRHPLL
jgi:hypothetical protein